jgi:hypothetical protein
MTLYIKRRTIIHNEMPTEFTILYNRLLTC